MAAGTWTSLSTTRTNLANGTFDLDTQSFSVALYTSSWTPTDTYSTTNELATANGYTRPGFSLGALSLSGTSTVTVDDPVDPNWTASGGSLTARYAALHNGTNVLCYLVLDTTAGGTDVTVTDGNQLQLTLHANGFFQMAGTF